MIYQLTPSTKDYIWGGTKLKEVFAKKANTDIIAETWELSCHADGASYIDSDCSKTLREFLSENPNAKGKACEQFSDFPILIKLIDAASNLSIQVHPSDEFALKNENQFGKTEMWYIVDCEKDAFLYYGFKEEVSALQLENAIKDNTLCDLLNKVNVNKGDVFFIEAGTIHAIGAGIVIAEIQQNSNVTYRVYDYGRLGVDGKPRDLHIEKACMVSKLTPETAPVFEKNHIAQCKYFTVDKMDISENYTDNCDETSFHALLLTQGSATIKCSENEIAANMGDTIFIPANTGEYTVICKGNCTYLKTYIEMPK